MSCASFRSLCVAAVPVLALTLGYPARAQMESREAISLQDQILELRHELQTMQAQQSQVGTAAPQPYNAQPGYAAPAGAGADMVPQLVARVNNLEGEVRDLRGQVDELQHDQQQAIADLGKRIDDLQFRLQNPQTAAGAGAPPASPGPSPAEPGARQALVQPPPPAASAPPHSAANALQQGYAALARRDYVTAQRAAEDILSRRASPQAYDAQYLLAQALAGEHQWSRAAIAYDDTYNRARKGVHAQEALLGLANSLTAIDEKRAACDTLAKLHAEFPEPRSGLRPQISAAEQRAACRA